MTEVHCERRDGIALLAVDNPPVNALSAALRVRLLEQVRAAAADPAVAALVITGAGASFIAGADIREFGKPTPPGLPILPEVIEAIEGLDKPAVAAINGTCAGGGLELALGCHARVALASARLGLPEVRLGLIPGAGGTQRLPRLIGLAPAIEMITGGELIPAARAAALGLVDRVVEGEIVAAALAEARRLAASGAPPRRTGALEERLAADRAGPDPIGPARLRVAAKGRGATAPLRALDAVAGALRLPLAEGLAAERAIFQECLASEQSAALRHVFLAERAAAKVPGLPSGPGSSAPAPVAAVAVIGCGTMGAGIAMSFANAGLPVTVVENEAGRLETGLAGIDRTYRQGVERGRLAAAEGEARRGRIAGATALGAAAGADLVIEAVFEDLDLKRRLFAELGRICRPDAILATNTSSLDVGAIAAAAARPERGLGLHFFSPASVMRLVEVVRPPAVDAVVLARALATVKRIGKVAVVVGVCDGFVGNRMLHAYQRQANALLLEGATPEQVDAALEGFGFAMGPFAVGDLAGLDVGWRVRQQRIARGQPRLPEYEVADRLCALERFGQKSGRGWYRYGADGRSREPDPETLALIEQVAAERGIARRPVAAPEILERCLYPLINEGARLLEEGVALRPGDIDTIWINGYGFPAWRGGPMHHADAVGLPEIRDRLAALAAGGPAHLRPARLLGELAEGGRRFADLPSA
jgi:3-hydroxyacyl-CoA dehydrogenase